MKNKILFFLLSFCLLKGACKSCQDKKIIVNSNKECAECGWQDSKTASSICAQKCGIRDQNCTIGCCKSKCGNNLNCFYNCQNNACNTP